MSLQELETLAVPSHSPQRSTVQRWGIALLRLLQDLRDSFMKDLSGRAVLTSYTGDATSYLTRGRTTVAQASGTLHPSSWQAPLRVPLSERLVLKRFDAGEAIHSQPFIAPPRLLLAGKQAGNCFHACCELLPTWRLKDHHGILIQHYCFDRALHDPLCRLLEAKKNALYSAQLGAITSPERPILELKDIFVQTGCAAHDGSGALKWGLARWGDKSVHDNLFLVMRSLRQTFDALLCHLRPWLMKNVVYDNTVEADHEAQWWRLLGVDADWVSEFVEVAPRWRDGILHVAAALETDRDRMEKISRVWIWSMRWRPFCLTRWGSVGPSCRSLLRSWALGLASLMEETAADPKVSEYYSSGFFHCGHAELSFACIAGVASYPVESWITSILEDDRLALHF